MNSALASTAGLANSSPSPSNRKSKTPSSMASPNTSRATKSNPKSCSKKRLRSCRVFCSVLRQVKLNALRSRAAPERETPVNYRKRPYFLPRHTISLRSYNSFLICPLFIRSYVIQIESHFVRRQIRRSFVYRNIATVFFASTITIPALAQSASTPVPRRSAS